MLQNIDPDMQIHENETDALNADRQTKKLRPHIKVQIKGNEPFFGPGVRSLLICITKAGSVREACGMMGLSYSKGRKIIERAEKELGFQIVVRTTGGINGGSARVSEEGMKILEKYEQFEQEMKEAAEIRFQKIFSEL